MICLRKPQNLTQMKIHDFTELVLGESKVLTSPASTEVYYTHSCAAKSVRDLTLCTVSVWLYSETCFQEYRKRNLSIILSLQLTTQEHKSQPNI